MQWHLIFPLTALYIYQKQAVAPYHTAWPHYHPLTASEVLLTMYFSLAKNVIYQPNKSL